MTFLRIDNIGRRHLTVWSLLFLVGATALVGYAGWQVLQGMHDLAAGGLLFAFFLTWFAWESTSPELESWCDSCGAPVTLHSGRDEGDRAVLVREAGKPRRLHVGPVSLVLARDKREFHFCSTDCASRGPIVQEGDQWTVDDHDWEVSG